MFARVARDLQFVLHGPELKKTIETQLSGVIRQSSPAAFARQIREEADVWQSLFESMNFKPE